MGKFFWNILISLDQLANTLLGGDPDETISSRAGKTVSTFKPSKILCKFLDLFDKGHCAKSIEPDEGSNATIK